MVCVERESLFREKPSKERENREPKWDSHMPGGLKVKAGVVGPGLKRRRGKNNLGEGRGKKK